MPNPSRKKTDPSLVRLALLVSFFFLCFVGAVLLANQLGRKDGVPPRPLVTIPDQTSQAR